MSKQPTALDEAIRERDEAERAVSRYENRVAELEKRIIALQDCVRASEERAERIARDSDYYLKRGDDWKTLWQQEMLRRQAAESCPLCEGTGDDRDGSKRFPRLCDLCNGSGRDRGPAAPNTSDQGVSDV